MSKLTLQQRLIEALIATARGTLIESRSRKYVTLKAAGRQLLLRRQGRSLALWQNRHSQHRRA